MIVRDPETEKFIDQLPEEQKVIYLFMRNEYDKVTNNGDNYNVEKHDKIVAKLASEKFDVSEEKAGKIYVDVEFKISEFHEKRLQSK